VNKPDRAANKHGLASHGRVWSRISLSNEVCNCGNPMTIYIESLLGINFGANMALLWMSGRGLGLRLNYWRLAGGAGLGAIYALVCLLSPGGLVTALPAKLTVACLMLAVAYAPQSLPGWMRLACVFALSAMAAAGFTLAATLGTGHNVLAGSVLIIGRHAATVLPLGLGLAMVAATAAGRALTGAAATKARCYKATIHVGEASATVTMLLDTGNKLIDPLSGLPVVIVEYSAVAQLVPKGWQQVITSGFDAAEQLSDLAATNDCWAHRLRLVPYRSLGASGTLVAFRPDRLDLATGGPLDRQSVERVVVAVSPRRLSLHGDFVGILPAGLIAG
jgi:stage II sporulation protein GA (sporulation sigma-E factor processing peptidase)